MAFGISFTPGQNGDNGERDQRAPNESIQRAIQILSLRLPRVMGGSALAPSALLQGQGAMGSPFGRSGMAQQQQMNPMLQALLQMAGMGDQGGWPGMGALNRPMAPRVIPGFTGDGTYTPGETGDYEPAGGPPPAPIQPNYDSEPFWQHMPRLPGRSSYADQFTKPWLRKFAGPDEGNGF